MGVCNIIFAFLTALAAVNFIFAEESGYLAPDDAYASDAYASDEKPPSKEIEHPKKNETAHNALNNCTNYCINCRQALHCSASHRGSIHTCGGRLRNCVNGKCSSHPSKECSNQ